MGSPGNRWYRKVLTEGIDGGLTVELHTAGRPRWRMRAQLPYMAATAVSHPGIPLVLPYLDVNKEGSVEAFVAAANKAVPELLAGCIVEEEEHIAHRRKVIEMLHDAKEKVVQKRSPGSC